MSGLVEGSARVQGSALVQGLGVSKTFRVGGLFQRSKLVQAVRTVDIHVERGEAVGVVGESGSGKSTLGRVLLGLIEATEGSVRFDGQTLSDLSPAAWRALRSRMQIVFQDPYGSLDPRRRVGEQIADGMAFHGIDKAERTSEVARLLTLVGLDPAHAARFSHEFSGGQRQRVGIARALAVQPEFLVADEPVSALDVSIQAQIVELLDRLRRELGLALLFISHDLPVVRHLCDRVVVMYLGRVMEEGPAKAVFDRPRHPYTQALISATPRVDIGRRTTRILLAGDPPSPSNPPSGCVFRTRCHAATDACAGSIPVLEPGPDGRKVACFRWRDLG